MGGRWYAEYQRHQNFIHQVSHPLAKATDTSGNKYTVGWDHEAMGQDIAAGIGKIPEDPIIKAHAVRAVSLLAESTPSAFNPVLKDHPELLKEKKDRNHFFREAFRRGNLAAAKLIYGPQSKFLETDLKLKEDLAWDLKEILSSTEANNPALLETLRAYEAALIEAVALNPTLDSERNLNIQLVQIAAKFQLSDLGKKLSGQIETNLAAFEPDELLKLAVLRGDPAFRMRVNAIVPNADTIALRAAAKVGTSKDVNQELANLEAHPPQSSAQGWQTLYSMIWYQRGFSESSRASRVLFRSIEERQRQIPSLMFEAARVSNWDVVQGFLAEGYRANMKHLSEEISSYERNNSDNDSAKTALANLKRLVNMQEALGPGTQGDNE